MSTVLITGAAGFVGSSLARLLARGDDLPKGLRVEAAISWRIGFAIPRWIRRTDVSGLRLASRATAGAIDELLSERSVEVAGESIRVFISYASSDFCDARGRVANLLPAYSCGQIGFREVSSEGSVGGKVRRDAAESVFRLGRGARLSPGSFLRGSVSSGFGSFLFFDDAEEFGVWSGPGKTSRIVSQEVSVRIELPLRDYRVEEQEGSSALWNSGSSESDFRCVRPKEDLKQSSPPLGADWLEVFPEVSEPHSPLMRFGWHLKRSNFNQAESDGTGAKEVKKPKEKMETYGGSIREKATWMKILVGRVFRVSQDPVTSDCIKLFLSANAAPDLNSVATIWKNHSRFAHALAVSLLGELFFEISRRQLFSQAERVLLSAADTALRNAMQAFFRYWEGAKDIKHSSTLLDQREVLRHGRLFGSACNLLLPSLRERRPRSKFELRGLVEKVARSRKCRISYDDSAQIHGCLVIVGEVRTIHIYRLLPLAERMRVIFHELGHLYLEHRAHSEFGGDEKVIPPEDRNLFAEQESDADLFAFWCQQILDASTKSGLFRLPKAGGRIEREIERPSLPPVPPAIRSNPITMKASEVGQ